MFKKYFSNICISNALEKKYFSKTLKFSNISEFKNPQVHQNKSFLFSKFSWIQYSSKIEKQKYFCTTLYQKKHSKDRVSISFPDFRISQRISFSFHKKSCFSKTIVCHAIEKENQHLDFFNFSFDKGRLKKIVSWFFENYGQYKTLQLLEKLKDFGFGYATLGGLSLGIDDLKIPDTKINLIATAETKVTKDFKSFRNAKITGVERMQRLIYTWNQTNDTLKQEVRNYFETKDLFNPIYMMAFSGARGNMSQVRQLVGMRGLMSDPQGQIIDFPIQSNFREGLTLTEYLISTYGARKGIVDTALRTATAGYLTRRLVDVAQHVIVSKFDCETMRGIFVFDMKEANKTIYSFQNRLIGRVLAQDIFSSIQKNGSFEKKKIASRNQEIDSNFALAISKVTKKAFVRSPLTCETPRLLCQLCYGWSLSQGKLVSVGEAVGVIAAQSIGEPGTQLTMRTFHTGGVFAGGLTDQILAPFPGTLQYVQNIPGICIRTSLNEIAFFTKMPGSFFMRKKNENNQNFLFSELYKIPAYAVLFVRNNEFVQKNQVLAQFSNVAQKQFQYGSAEQTLFSNLAGELYLSHSNIPFSKKEKFRKMNLLIEKRSEFNTDYSALEFKSDIVWKTKNWAHIWILSGKEIYNALDSNIVFRKGDAITQTSVLNRIIWKKPKNLNIQFSTNSQVSKKISNMFYFLARENSKNSLFFSSNFSFLFQKISKIFLFSLFKTPSNQKNDVQNQFPNLSSKHFQIQKMAVFPIKKRGLISNTPISISIQKKYINIQKLFGFIPNFQNTFVFSNSKVRRDYESHTSNIVEKMQTLHIQKNIWKNFLFFSNFQNFSSIWSPQFLSTNIMKIFPFFPFSSNFCFSNPYFDFQLQNTFKKTAEFLNVKNPQLSNKNAKIQLKNNIFSQHFRKFFLSFLIKNKKIRFRPDFQKNKEIDNKTLYIPFSLNKAKLNVHRKTNLEKKAMVSNFSESIFRLQKNRYFLSSHISFSILQSHTKRMFSKFSTFLQIPSFHIYNFRKIFHISHNYLFQKYSKLLSFNQESLIPLFPVFPAFSGFLWHIGNFPIKISFSIPCFVEKKQKISDQHSFLYLSSRKNKWRKQHIFVLNRNSEYSQKSIFEKNKKLGQLSPTHFSFSFAKKSEIFISNDQKQILKVGNDLNKNLTFSPHKSKSTVLIKDFKKHKNLSIFSLFQWKKQNLCFKTNIYSNFVFQSNFQNNKSQSQKQLFFKKSLYSFTVDKIRYRNFGYTFSLTAKSKHLSSSYFFRIFSKIHQPIFHEIQTINLGKLESHGSFQNGYFFGKHFPTTLSYCFPKNFETSTNGIFCVQQFEPLSYRKKFSKFLCLKREFWNFSSIQYLAKISPFFIFQKYEKNSPFFEFSKNANFNNTNLSSKKMEKDLVNDDIQFQNDKFIDFEKNIFKRVNISKNSSQFSSLDMAKNMLSRKKNFQVSFFMIDTFAFLRNFHFESFSFNKYMYSKKLNKKKKMKNSFFQTLNLSKNTKFENEFFENYQRNFHFFLEKKNVNFRKSESLSSAIEKQKNSLFSDNLSYQNFEKFSISNVFSKNYSNSEFYANEIFWIPQENYTLSNIDLFSFCFEKKSKIQKFEFSTFLREEQQKQNLFLSKISSKNVPLFYLTNRQGKKIPFFSHLDGISNSFIFPNRRNFRKFSKKIQKRMRTFNSFSHFEWLQQKISFYNKKNKFFYFPFVKNFQKKKNFDSIYGISKEMNSKRTLFAKTSDFMNSSIFQKKIQEKNDLLVFKKQKNIQKSSIVFKKYKKNLNKQKKQKLFTLNISKKKKYVLNFLKIQFFLFKDKYQTQFCIDKKNTFYDKTTNFDSKKTKKNEKMSSNKIGFSKNIQKFLNHFRKNFSMAFFQKKENGSFENIQKLFRADFFVPNSQGGTRKKSLRVLDTTQRFRLFYKKNLKIHTQIDFNGRNKKNIQISKFISNQCFTCLPFFYGLNKKTQHSYSYFLNKKNPISFGQNNKFSLKDHKFPNSLKNGVQPHSQFYSIENKNIVTKNIENKNIVPKRISSNIFQSCFTTKKMYIKVQSGWFFIFPNRNLRCFSNSHQTLLKPGCFFKKNLCFEQNRIYQETLICDFLDFSPKSFDFNISKFQNQNIENIHKNFVPQSFFKNVSPRFFNHGAFFAMKNMNIFEFEKNLKNPQMNKNFQNLDQDQNFENRNLTSQGKRRSQKILASFFKPFQYKIVENPKNSKKVFQSSTIQNFSSNCPFKNQNLCLWSSKKLYKFYHSSISNPQQSDKIFLQNIGVDSHISSQFQNLNLQFYTQQFNSNVSPMLKHLLKDKKSFQKKLQKYQLTSEHTSFGSTNNAFNNKKQTNQNFEVFRQNSRNNSIQKFQSFVARSNSRTFKARSDFQFNKNNLIQKLPISFKTSCLESSYLRANKQRNQRIFPHSFFSFYPVQFLPLKISNSSFNVSNTFLVKTKVPIVLINSIQSTLDFSFYERRANFLNQRLFSFDTMSQQNTVFFNNALFWLNKEKTNFLFLKNTIQSMWENLLVSQKQKSGFSSQQQRNQSKQTKIHKIIENFIFQNNSNYFANTQFLSPFNGELVSVYTNETNWWKKASEISTVQKLDTLFSAITKKDLFAIHFSDYSFPKVRKLKKISNSHFQNLFCHLTYLNQSNFPKTFTIRQKTFIPKIFIFSKKNKKVASYIEKNDSCFFQNRRKDFLSTKQKNLSSLYFSVLNKEQNFEFFKNLFGQFSNFRIFSDFQKFKFSNREENTVSPNSQKIIKNDEMIISSFVTKYQNKLYMLKNIKIGYPKLFRTPSLGQFLVYGDCVFNNALSKPGQVIHISSQKMTFRRAQPFFISPKGILHFSITPHIQKNIPIVTLPYNTVQSGDIVQGIPKVEQFFEARTTVHGRLFMSSLPILLKGIFQKYKSLLPLEQAVRQSFLKIQQLIVDGVQRVYRSQGVSIIDKHLEVVVRQMTTKVQIIHGGQTGFFPGELVNLEFIERINKFLIVKIRYEPIILGITRASLEVESFLSASSFQQTTKILSLASISRKKDFLKGLKENLLVGNLIPSGTGYMVLYKNF
jgi:hypothetical protein